jgi:hypothetical protein
LSKGVGGKAITQDTVFAQVKSYIEHNVSNQTSNIKSSKGPKKVAKSQCKTKSLKSKSSIIAIIPGSIINNSLKFYVKYVYKCLCLSLVQVVYTSLGIMKMNQIQNLTKMMVINVLFVTVVRQRSLKIVSIWSYSLWGNVTGAMGGSI